MSDRVIVSDAVNGAVMSDVVGWLVGLKFSPTQPKSRIVRARQKARTQGSIHDSAYTILQSRKKGRVLNIILNIGYSRNRVHGPRQ